MASFIYRCPDTGQDVQAWITWDRACWLAAQALLSRISADIVAMPAPLDQDDEVRVH